jgi:hypothetical protein
VNDIRNGAVRFALRTSQGSVALSIATLEIERTPETYSSSVALVQMSAWRTRQEKDADFQTAALEHLPVP